MWARWAAISAAFVAEDSPWGPRISTSLGWFEGSTRSGSTLHLIPGNRAVLSGGVWNAPELDAAYNDGAPLPHPYLGAPAWVAEPVLNPRTANGLLSFCYWWDGAHWYRGESPIPDGLGPALPGVWTDHDTVDVVTALVGEHRTSAVTELVTAAEAGSATRSLLVRAFGDDTVKADSAYYQLLLAGVVTDSATQDD